MKIKMDIWLVLGLIIVSITMAVVIENILRHTIGATIVENITQKNETVKALDMNLINQSGLQGAIVIHKGNDVYLQQGNLIVKVTK